MFLAVPRSSYLWRGAGESLNVSSSGHRYRRRRKASFFGICSVFPFALACSRRDRAVVVVANLCLAAGGEHRNSLGSHRTEYPAASCGHLVFSILSVCFCRKRSSWRWSQPRQDAGLEASGSISCHLLRLLPVHR